jgi:tRNA threonylcarbamoyladenosine biosynthesis protein TsaE
VKKYTNLTLDDLGILAQEFINEYLTQFAKVFFYGEMGVGKTTFINAICYNLGVLDKTSSPTFSLVNQYQISQKDKILYHADLYRLKSAEEAYDAGIYELFDNEDYLFIEWPEIVEEFVSEKVLKVRLTLNEDQTRTIVVSND